MPRRSGALIGPGKGPKVQVKNHGKIKATAGEAFVLHCHGAGGTTEIPMVGHDEPIPFAACDYAQVEYNGQNRNFIACVFIGD